MTTAELQNIKADKVVDARGVSCPGPITRRLLPG
ncbi:MAG: hypothetical protein PWP72_1198 [Thermoanaerobacter sp.]|nr:hypothetical protein [Thermoanaerobacter sp.]